MSFNKLTKLAIACGGTGGHFYPGLSIAREFKKQGGEVTLLLSGKHSIKQAEIAEIFGIPSIQIPSSPRSLRPAGLLKFLKDLFIGIIKGRKAFKQLTPDAFLAMGSFASIPSALAAKLQSVPLFLHEGNARIGKANILLSRWAKLLAIAFPPVNAAKNKAPLHCIGMPVRPELLENNYSKQEAIEQLNKTYNTQFNAELPTLLIFGGSQGTQRFNEVIPTQISALEKNKLQIIHLTGAGKREIVDRGYSHAQCNTLILESSPHMDIFYQACDAVICRSGGSTLAELAIFGKFSVLVPYPYSADGHQVDNAEFQQTSQGAILITNDNFTNEACADFLGDWLKDPEKYNTMGQNSAALAKPGAAIDMLSLIDQNI